MTAHVTRLFEDGDGWTATCADEYCGWQSTSAVAKCQAAQEAELHTAVKAGRSWPCCASDVQLPDDERGGDYAVCPACGLTVEIVHGGRYAPHSMIVDDLEGWAETTAAAVEGGWLAVRRLKGQALIRTLSALLYPRKKAS